MRYLRFHITDNDFSQALRFAMDILLHFTLPESGNQEEVAMLNKAFKATMGRMVYLQHAFHEGAFLEPSEPLGYQPEAMVEYTDNPATFSDWIKRDSGGDSAYLNLDTLDLHYS